MKRLFSIVVLVVMVGFALSCASNPPANAMGEVAATFESSDIVRGNVPDMGIATIFLLPYALVLDLVHIPVTRRLSTAAHSALLEVAKARYGEDVDVTRVRWSLAIRNPIRRGLHLYNATGIAVPSTVQ